MITYSTNMMGPWHTCWYVERGLTHKATRVVTTDVIKGYSPGDVIEYDEITTHYAGGRIDIYGLPDDEYYAGKSEYGIPVMLGTDWEAFSCWLEQLETQELWSYDLLLREFQFAIGRQITWAPEKPETKTWLDQRANLL